MGPTATDLLAQVLLHGVIAALVVESLVARAGIAAPAERFQYRVSALALPIVLAAIFPVALPFRHDPWFQDVSVFVSGRWTLLRVGDADVRATALVVACVAGLFFLARDGLHLLLDAWRVQRREGRIAREPAPRLVLDPLVDLAAHFHVAPPAVDVLAAPAHALHCRGILRPRIVISTGTIEALTPDQLRTALAHELAHIAHHDVLRGWVLFVLRALQPFNPVAQAVGRRAAQELEWRADDRAAEVTARPLALAHALVRCARRRGDRFLGLSGHGRFKTLEERCRRLLAGPVAPSASTTSDLVALWSALTLLLVFVQ